jgi:cardiolipin synthase
MDHLSLLYLGYIVGEWVIRLGMLPVVVRGGRRPDSAMAWLLVINFLPFLGLLLYALLGNYRLPQRRVRRHSELQKQFNEIRQRLESHPQCQPPAMPKEYEPIVRLAERLGYYQTLGHNKMELMIDTNEVIDTLISEIDQAKHHVHLLYYIFANDQTGRRVADALSRAAARGVECRLLVDAVGSRPFFKTLAPELRKAGVDVQAALPVNPFRRKAARIDLRNHRKLAVIDGHVAFAGSQNIVDANYGHKDLAWCDMSTRLHGPTVLQLQSVFVIDWYFETDVMLTGAEYFPVPAEAGDALIQLLPSGPSYPTENYQRAVTAALYAAKRQVIITTPYFIPDEPLLQAVQVAASRGVDVILIVPSRSDQKLVGAAGRAYYEDILRAGARLYLFEAGLLHAKTVTVDDSIAVIGSSNFDIRSFMLNFELSLLVYGPEPTNQLREKQLSYLKDARELTWHEWQNRPRMVRLLQNIARLFSPLL